MQGRVYSVSIAAVAATVQVDFFEVNVASTRIVEILELHLSQSTEIGDAMEENLTLLIETGHGTTGSGGSATTARPRFIGDSAYAGSAATMNTTKASTGTPITHETHAWNIRLPFTRIWTPDSTIWVPPSGRLTVELTTTPTDSITFSGTLIIREYG